MTNLVGDSEEQRFVDRIRALAWKEVRDAGASFITQQWISDRLRRPM